MRVMKSHCRMRRMLCLQSAIAESPKHSAPSALPDTRRGRSVRPEGPSPLAPRRGSLPPSTHRERRALERVGKYELVRKLARGGMAEVFLARFEWARGLDKTVVVKRILPQLA